VCRDGAVAAVLSVLPHHDADVTVARSCCSTMASLASSDENDAVLGRDGAGAAVIAAMRRHEVDALVARHGCVALPNLTA